MSGKHYPTATGNAVLRAYARVAKNVEQDAGILESASSAGFILEPACRGELRHGYQVFVQMVRFDEGLLKKRPETGGLLVRAKKRNRR